MADQITRELSNIASELKLIRRALTEMSKYNKEFLHQKYGSKAIERIKNNNSDECVKQNDSSEIDNFDSPIIVKNYENGQDTSQES